jgi:hypothetical protein
MVLKIGLENTPDLRWIAILLDKSAPQARAESAELSATSEAAGEPVVARIHEEGTPVSTTRAHRARG